MTSTSAESLGSMPQEQALDGQLNAVSLHDQHPLSIPVRTESGPTAEVVVADNKPPKGAQDSISRHYMSQAMKLRTAVIGGAAEEVLSQRQALPSRPAVAQVQVLEEEEEKLPVGPLEVTEVTSTSGREFPKGHSALTSVNMGKQKSFTETIASEVEEERVINQTFCSQLCGRLDSSRKATERLLGVFRALSAAETAYSKALLAASNVDLSSVGDGAVLQSVFNAFSSIPHVTGQAHALVNSSLGDLIKDLQVFVSDLRKLCSEVTSGATQLRRKTETSRKQLQQAVNEHLDACREMDLLVADRRRGRPGRALDMDPWHTECKMLLEHLALLELQSEERKYLYESFRRVRSLEVQRVESMKKVVGGFCNCYKTGVAPVKQEVALLRKLVDQLQAEADVVSLEQAAHTAVTSGDAAAKRQADMLHSRTKELLNSPEIVRQGPLGKLNPPTGEYEECYFALTRAGFLHWFASVEENGLPVDLLHLAKCQFEAGEVPCFNLVEKSSGVALFGGGKSRVVCFKAPSIEECIEWAGAIKDAMSLFVRRQ